MNCRFCAEYGPPVWSDMFKQFVHSPKSTEPWNEGYPVPCSKDIAKDKSHG